MPSFRARSRDLGAQQAIFSLEINKNWEILANARFQMGHKQTRDGLLRVNEDRLSEAPHLYGAMGPPPKVSRPKSWDHSGKTCFHFGRSSHEILVEKTCLHFGLNHEIWAPKHVFSLEMNKLGEMHVFRLG